MNVKQAHADWIEIPKLQGAGKLKYQLWVDAEGRLYVQIKENTASGTFSALLFSVSKYSSIRNSNASIGMPVGFDLVTRVYRKSENENDGGFLKAVLRHLLPE